MLEGRGDSEGGDVVDLTDSKCSWRSKSNLQLLKHLTLHSLQRR